ncbi:immunoglobulin alpha-2 heavy chain-like isoform X2 [Acipenser oxyrinchus oxyrinchus]|nr:immunoglobulin alpha-2 heavy chain-like isoform X2 [Acipenser oxyrinchus oxyrinchus]
MGPDFIIVALILKAAQAVVVQYPRLVRAEVGGSVNLSCDLGDLTRFCYTVMWLRFQSETSVLTAYTNQSPASHGSAGAEKICNFTRSNLQASDSGTYYCVVVNGPVAHFGNGSTLVVKKHFLGPPSIAILSPSAGEVQSNGSATLVCLVFGVSEQARVYWDIAGSVRHGLTDSGSGDSSESTPDFIRNQISIPGEVWSSGAACTCVVETESGRNMSKTVTKIGNPKACAVLHSAMLAVVSFILITLLLILVMIFNRRKAGQTNSYLANERDDVTQTAVRYKHQTAGRNTKKPGSGARQHSGAKQRAVREDVQYASLEFDRQGRR